MKLIQHVPTREIKLCFVISDFVRMPKRGKKYLGDISRIDFLKRLRKETAKCRKLSPAELDDFIQPHRLFVYNAADWYVADMSVNELGVWRRAGGLPLEWTNRSLQETAKKVSTALETNSHTLKQRARHGMMNMLKTNIIDLQKEKYLLPIVFKGGTGTNGRRRLKHRTKGDIDDGNMRAVALAVNGAKTLRVYFGVPVPKKTH